MRYTRGMYLVTGFKDDEPKFGKILKIIINQNRLLFATETQEGVFDHHFSAYMLKPTQNNVLIHHKDLSCFYPLSVYTVGGNMYVVLKFHVIDTADV